MHVDPDSTTFITRRGGTATVMPRDGRPSAVSAGEELVVSGAGTPTLQSFAAPDLDGWDRWNYDRTDHLLDSMSARYVADGVYGPRRLGSVQRRRLDLRSVLWLDVGVDDAPWGWAPFHYGRWADVDGFWAWAPGPIVPPVYAPACVGWLGGGIGVGWVALSWGEPLFPWWGPPGFIGAAWWGGWGGPWIVDHRRIEHRNVVDVRNITYTNSSVAHAVIATRTDRFGRGSHDYVRPSTAEVREMHGAEHGVDVRPTAASLAPGAGRGVRPPGDELRTPPSLAGECPRSFAARAPGCRQRYRLSVRSTTA